MLIPIGDWNCATHTLTFLFSIVWNHAYPHWGLKPRKEHQLWLQSGEVWNHAYPHWGLKRCCTSLSSLTLSVWNHAYPHWGLKRWTRSTSATTSRFEIMLIPIGDWNFSATSVASRILRLKSCLSPLGIETSIFSSFLSLLMFEIMLIPIGDWNYK